jgi:hypothetical protein
VGGGPSAQREEQSKLLQPSGVEDSIEEDIDIEDPITGKENL